jgi:hypothetical protein
VVHMLLASQLTIYVGGLVVFVPSNNEGKELDLFLLKGNSFMHGHNLSVGSHEGYLVVRADDLCFKANETDCKGGASQGYRMIGGAGLDQLARFRLEEEVTVTGPDDLNVPIKLTNVKLAPVGKLNDSSCAQEVRPHKDLLDDWPVEAALRLENAVVTPTMHTGLLKFQDDCAQFNQVVADRLELKVKVTRNAILKWGDGSNQRIAVLKDKDLTVAIWNLPKERDVYPAEEAHASGDHFVAYYSVLEDRKKCLCRPGHFVRFQLGDESVVSSEPIFCPPAQASPAP